MSRYAEILGRFKYIHCTVLLAVLVVAFSSCGMPFSYGFDGVWDEEDGDPSPPTVEPTLITVQGEEFTLAWNESLTTEYRVYQRPHGSAVWALLATVTDVSQLTIDTGMLPYGEYDFAVTAVGEGSESGFHTSLDGTADPSCGWYLEWVPEA